MLYSQVVPSAEPGFINMSAGKTLSLSLQPETLKAMQCLSSDAALFVYTSGTTGPPKGASAMCAGAQFCAGSIPSPVSKARATRG